MLRAAVAQIVPIDTGDHDIFELHRRNGLCEIGRFARIGCQWPAMGNIAKRAAARAQVSQDHERRRAFAEAFTNVRTGCFLAHGVQVMFAQGLLDFLKARAPRCSDANPVRFFERNDRYDLDRIAASLLFTRLAVALDGHGHPSSAASLSSNLSAINSAESDTPSARSCVTSSPG